MTNGIASGRLHGKDLADAYFTRGIFRFQLHDVDDAIADYSQAIATVDSKDARQQRAEAYLTKADYADSLADYATLVTLEPDSADWHLRRAEILQVTGDGAGHDGEMKLALARTNDPVKLLKEGAVFQNARGNYQIAYNDSTAALAMKPDDFVLQSDRGAFALMLGRYQDALADIDVALKADPAQHVAHNTATSKMIALYAQGRYQDAAAQGLITDPSDPYTLLWLFIVQSRTGGSDMQARAGKADLDAWPGPVIAYYTGKIGRTDLLDKVDSSGKPDQIFYRRCEFQFYTGEFLRIHGDDAGAGYLLKTAADTCPYDELERAGAQIELRAKSSAGSP